MRQTGSSWNRAGLVALFLAAWVFAACAPTAPNAPEQGDAPYVVLVSFDGFRWDYASMTETPAMDRMAREGLKAEALQPVFPTITFPNHFSIATGQQPWRHGIVANDFPDETGQDWYHLKDRTTVQDGRWYRAEPVWVTAEKAGMRTAAYYFVGTEADIGGIRPTHWRSFDADVPGRARVNQVLDWLTLPEDTRPHLLTLYFEDVDDYGHWYGPESEENMAAVRRVDALLGRLLDGIDELPHGDEVYVVLVSDHGQARYRYGDPLVLSEVVDLGDAVVVGGGPYAFIHLPQGDASRAPLVRDAINEHWNCGRAYLPAELPAAWKAGSSERYPEIFVQAAPGCGVIASGTARNKITAGDHGWAPEVPEMQGIFYAMGPRIPRGEVTGPVHATDVYPLLMSILGLEAPGPIDGDPGVLASRLLPEKE